MAEQCHIESTDGVDSSSKLSPAQGEIHSDISASAAVSDGAVVVPPTIQAVPEGVVTSPQQLLRLLPRKIRRVVAKHGGVYVVMEGPSQYAVLLRSPKGKLVIRSLAQHYGIALRSSDVADIIEYLHADAEMHAQTVDVWQRVAVIPGGVEIDLGDENHNRVRITPGMVELVAVGSTTLFARSSTIRPMPVPAAAGNIKLLKGYLNIYDDSFVLLVAYLTYTLAHAKVSTSKFLILVIGGHQGSGKTWTNRVIKRLIDPSAIEVQSMPGNGRDLAIAAQGAHLLCYDNLRALTPAVADLLCIASTGGSVATRQLYTDAEQAIHVLHVALVLNGIHSFIDQPDLAQRCLRIDQRPLAEGRRRTEEEMTAQLNADMPVILRGIFELIANILTHLPEAEVTNPERMLDFVRWLAAMEKVNAVPAGVYQAVYSATLQQGQLDSLMENHLAAVVVEFAETHMDGKWSGTPAELLAELNAHVAIAAQRTSDWPKNPISLSKRLNSLQAGLSSQGIRVELTRGKQRTVTITKIGGSHD